MKYTILNLMMLATASAMGQSIDSTKAKPSPNVFSKYEKRSEFGGLSAPASTSASGQPPMIQKFEEKRVQSTYQYKNGQVVGGKTTITLEKKKKD